MLFHKLKEKISWFCNKRSYATCWFDGCCGAYWGHCAKCHDRRYENKRLNRKQADELLYRCVLKKSNRINATIMWIGVRMFGWYFYKKANNEQ